MFRTDTNMLLVQLLNLQIRYMGDSKRLHGLDALKEIFALAIHNVKLAREGKQISFKHIWYLNFHVGDKVLVRTILGMSGVPSMMLLIVWYV